MCQPSELDAFIAAYPPVDSSSEIRIESCRRFWEAVPESRRVQLLVDVLGRYRECRQTYNCSRSASQLRESFALNELTSTCYTLRLKPSEDEALAILRTAFHTCGHGSDTGPPLDLALRHFRKKLYTPNLFDAVKAYRESLSSTRQTTAQLLKGRMDVLLWQDLRQETPWSACWTAHIHADLRAMPSSLQEQWRALFQTFHHCIKMEPTKKWLAASTRPLEVLGPKVLSIQAQKWLLEPLRSPTPVMSAVGSHVMKNLVWCGIVLNDPVLDRSLMRLIEIPWKKRQPIDKIACALACLWSDRDPHQSRTHVELITKQYGFKGGQIDRFLNKARKKGGMVGPALTAVG